MANSTQTGIQASAPRPEAAAGIVCIKGRQVLLVRRGTPPMMGEWSIPGGRIETGEKASDAALRELHEETGVQASLLGLVDVVDAIVPARDGTRIARHYVLCDYAAAWLSGEPVAGDDALEARFFTLEAVRALTIWPETVRVIETAFERYSSRLP